MSYQCGWCSEYLQTAILNDEHMKNSPVCFKREGPISITGRKNLESIIGTLYALKRDAQMSTENELKVSEALILLKQV